MNNAQRNISTALNMGHVHSQETDIGHLTDAQAHTSRSLPWAPPRRFPGRKPFSQRDEGGIYKFKMKSFKNIVRVVRRRGSHIFYTVG
jgi:hypothetical protein